MSMYIDEKRKSLIGKRIQLWRKQRKLTQEGFAALIERSTDAVSMIERGINFPSRETLEKMSKALNIPIKDFLEITNEDVNTTERQKTLDKILGILHKLDDKKLQMALKHVEVLVY
jgi:transcriptional regulator with XRE-family HTH domain